MRTHVYTSRNETIVKEDLWVTSCQDDKKTEGMMWGLHIWLLHEIMVVLDINLKLVENITDINWYF